MHEYTKPFKKVRINCYPNAETNYKFTIILYIKVNSEIVCSYINELFLSHIKIKFQILSY